MMGAGVIGGIAPDSVEAAMYSYLTRLDADEFITQKEFRELTHIVNDELNKLHLVPKGEKGVPQMVAQGYLKRINYRVLDTEWDILRDGHKSGFTRTISTGH